MKIRLNYKKRYILILINLIFIAFFTITKSDVFMGISGLLLFILIITGDSMGDFYTYLSMIPFFLFLTNSSTVMKYLFFGLIFISVIKLMLNKTKHRINTLLLLSGIFLLFIQFFNDILIGRIIQSLSVFLYMSYFILFIIKSDLKNYNHDYALKYIVAGFIAVLFIIGIGSSNPLSHLALTDKMIRLGDEATILGGAMGIPIYSLLTISLLSSHMIINKISSKQKFAFIACMCFALLIGFLSISRAYILGLMIISFLLSVSLFTKQRKKIFLFIIIGMVIGTLFIFLNPEYVEILLSKYTQRTFDISSNIRLQIYGSSLEYLLEHFNVLLLGLGARNYVEVGKQGGYLFAMMAHNLYLDAIMSWGVIGFMLVISLIIGFIKISKKYSKNKISILSVMPAIVLAGLYMTEGTFNYFNIYLYLLFIILNSFYLDMRYKGNYTDTYRVTDGIK